MLTQSVRHLDRTPVTDCPLGESRLRYDAAATSGQPTRFACGRPEGQVGIRPESSRPVGYL